MQFAAEFLAEFKLGFSPCQIIYVRCRGRSIDRALIPLVRADSDSDYK
jgi:hypothetical protein